MSLRNTQVTYLHNVRSPANFKSVTLGQALSLVTGDKLKNRIDDMRVDIMVGDDDAYRAKKTKLPSVCFHGTFADSLTNEHFNDSSQLFAFDIDHLDAARKAEIKTLLTADPRIVYVFVSPSGEGLKAAFRVAADAITDDASYKTAFVQVEKHFADIGVEIDKSCKDIRRVCFLTCDPEAYTNYDAEIFQLTANPAATTPANTATFEQRKAERRQADADLDGLPDYGDAQEEDGYTPITEADDTGVCPDITLENAAGYLPTTFATRQDWLNVGAALHHQFSADIDALEIFDTWSQSVPGYTDFDSIQAAWKSFGKRQGGKPYTFRSIIQAYNKAHPVVEEREAVSDWRAALDAHVEKFSKNNAQVMIGGKHRIMWRQTKNDAYEFSAQNERSLMFQHRLIKTGEKVVYGLPQDVFSNHLIAWAKHPKTRIYMGGVAFKPNQETPGCYNTWQGYAVKPEQNDALLALIRYHVETVICGLDKALIDYFYDWCAYTLQNPEVPGMSALVLRGKKGSGKGTMGLFLGKIWGVHARFISNPKQLIGNFNAHLADACFLFADEAFFSGDKKHEGVLKALITEPTMMVERKGVDAYQDTNYLKVLMATNEKYAVPATDDERRFAVYDVADTYCKDGAYFDRLVAAVKDKAVQSAFLYEMLNRDISAYRPGNIPESYGLREQRFGSLCPIGKWLADYLTADYADDEIGEGWETLQTCADLFNKYLDWCNDQRTGAYDRVGQIPFSKYMKGVFRKTQVGAGRLAGFVMGTQEEAQWGFETAKKISLQV